LPKHNVFTIPYLSFAQRESMLKKGVRHAWDIPASVQLTDRQKQYIRCARTGKAEVDRQGLAEYMAELIYPIYYLDFETVNPAIPVLKGTTAYQQWPFQFSCYVQSRKGTGVTYFEFLQDRERDPRLPLIQALLRNIGTRGSIVVYHAAFETSVLRSLAQASPQYGEQLKDLIPRLWDQEQVFLRYVMHPDFLGRTSLKSVLPVMTGMDYDGLKCKNGADVQLWYWKMKSLPAGADRDAVRRDMLDYCRQDTMGMVKINEALMNHV